MNIMRRKVASSRSEEPAELSFERGEVHVELALQPKTPSQTPKSSGACRRSVRRLKDPLRQRKSKGSRTTPLSTTTRGDPEGSRGVASALAPAPRDQMERALSSRGELDRNHQHTNNSLSRSEERQSPSPETGQRSGEARRLLQVAAWSLQGPIEPFCSRPARLRTPEGGEDLRGAHTGARVNPSAPDWHVSRLRRAFQRAA
jgi:hypothetical protein